MKIITMSPAQQAEIKVLQQSYTVAQQQHLAAYKAMFTHLQQISGVQPEQGRKVKLTVSDDGQHIIYG